MSENFEQRVSAVDAATLTHLVRQALSQPTAEVLDWTSAPLVGGAAEPEEGVIGRVLFTGHAQVDQSVESWSLVLKAFAPPRNRPPLDPTNLSYWKREVLAFQSGLLDDLPSSITTPRCFAVVEFPSEETWVWMEYIHDAYKRWSLEQYKLAARDLGRFNGAYITGRALPTYPWLNIGNFRHWFSWGEAGLPHVRQLAHHPRSWVTLAAAEETLQLTSQHERLLACLEQLPQCLCHHDAFRRNLMIRRNDASEEQTVAIDWAAVGPGAVGEEIASMVGLSLYFLEVDAEEIPRLDEMVFAGYLEGLGDAGWQGNERIVRLGYTAAAGLFIASTVTGFVLPRIENETEMASWDGMYGRDRWLESNRQTHRYGLQLGQEALSLLNSF